MRWRMMVRILPGSGAACPGPWSVEVCVRWRRHLFFPCAKYMTIIPKYALVLAVFLSFSACALFSSWHWSRPGASDADYAADEAQCKARVYSGTDGMVTNASVRRMHGCMEGKGWIKQPN